MPVSAYDGSIKGYQATKLRKGQKLDPNSPQVINYKSYLESRHDAVLGAVGGGKKLYSYGYVFNGFAADLSEAQAAKLRTTPGVLSVEKDVALRARHVDHACLPGPQRTGRRLGHDRSQGRERHHRHRRRRRLAGAPELFGSHGRQRQRDQGRQARLPADSWLERQVHARVSSSPRRIATRS